MKQKNKKLQEAVRYATNLLFASGHGERPSHAEDGTNEERAYFALHTALTEATTAP